MAQTPEWWLNRLAHRLDLVRPRIAHLRRYLDGDAPLPEGAEGCKEAYKKFQRKARTNLAELVVDAVVERMVPGGFLVGDSNQDDNDARRIWKANRLEVWSVDVHRDMVGLRSGYVCVQPGEDGVEITHERPEQVITEHDPARPDRRRAGLKVYRDEVAQLDFAYVHHRDGGAAYVTPFAREFKNASDGLPQPILTVAGGWEQIGETRPTGLRNIAIVPFMNRGGLGEFETHTDVLDRINWVILQRLVIIAMQAYRQRAIKTQDGQPLPETDEDGKPIDYGELLKPGPGAVWELPPGADLWESAQTDIQQVLQAAKDDIRDLAAVTRTPLGMLIPDGQNQSAAGASYAREGLVFKTEDRTRRAGPSWSEVLRLALALERDVTEDEIPQVDIEWMPPDRPSMAERYDSLTKAGADVPWRSKMTDILGFDGDKVDRMATERVEDAMLAATIAPTQPPQEQTSAEGDDGEPA